MEELDNSTRFVLAKLQLILDELDYFSENITGKDAAEHIRKHIPELQKLTDEKCNPKKLKSCVCLYKLHNSNRSFCYYCNAPVS